MYTRTPIELEKFKTGTKAYLTKGFSTYYVQYEATKSDRVVVKVVRHLLTHKNVMNKAGFKNYPKYVEGNYIVVHPNELWLIANIERTSFMQKAFNKVKSFLK